MCTSHSEGVLPRKALLSTALPTLVVHADWGSNPKKRWMTRATLCEDGHYLVDLPELVGELARLFSRLQTIAGVDGCAFLGFDFPIGLPVRYAEQINIKDFLSLLSQLGRGQWASFYSVAERPNQIGLYRPFYPQRPGGTKQQYLLDALGVESINDLRRRCEQARPDRRAAAPIFWTMGAQQVGKAAIIGWRDVLGPALREGILELCIWPFSGHLFELFQPRRIVVAETYPAEFYIHLGMTFPPGQAGRKSGKRIQSDRADNAAILERWADAVGVAFSPSLRTTLWDGFGCSKDAEDRFDATIGLLGMLNVVLGHRPPGEPGDEYVRKIEGWILGQSST